MLYHALGKDDALPNYTHLPMVLGPDGRRLAKRHGDTRVGHYRAAGVPAGRVRGLLARWLGLGERAELSMTPQQIVERFDLTHVSHEALTMTEDDERQLMQT